MTLFTLPVSCAVCGGPVGLLNAVTSGLLSVAIVECPACQREWEITSRMVFHGLSQAGVERSSRAKRSNRSRAVSVPA